MNIRNQKANKQLCQPRRSMIALTCAPTGTACFSFIAHSLEGIQDYAQQNYDDIGMT